MTARRDDAPVARGVGGNAIQTGRGECITVTADRAWSDVYQVVGPLRHGAGLDVARLRAALRIVRPRRPRVTGEQLLRRIVALERAMELRA